MRGYKIAMLVFNTCHADARVLRQADTLQKQGAQVRIFAIANAKYPAGLVVLPNGVEIERTPVKSLFNYAFEVMAKTYHLVRRTDALARRRARRTEMTAQVDYRTRAERREALRRMGVTRRTVRLLKMRYAEAGKMYRWHLRSAYLNLHAFAKKALRPIHKPTQQLNFWMRVQSKVEAWKPDVVHSHDANVLVPAARAAYKTSAALVYDSHELWRHRNRGDRKAPIGKIVDALIEMWGVRRADAVITVSPGLVKWLEDNYKLDNVHLLRNTPSRVPSTDAPSLREMANLTDDDQIVLYTGRITTGRGIEETLHAISEMPKNVYLVMLGYGQPEYMAELDSLADFLGVTDRFRHVGAVPHEQVSATASQADVSVVAVQPTCLSYLHCLPNKLFEAVQAGLPVVASKLPDVHDLLHEHQIGSTFALGDIEDMRKALGHALKDPASLKRNVKQAAEILCWEVEQKKLVSLYMDLLKPEYELAS